MSFTAPVALALLLALPYVAWLGKPVGQAGAVRAWAGVAIRCTVALLIILALAGGQVVTATDKLALVFLVDVSDSIPLTTQQLAVDWVDRAIRTLSPEDSAAVILFGADALVERPLSSVPELAPTTSVPDPMQTDIGAAMQLSLALLPTETARRIILLSDGIDTMGNAIAGAGLAAAAGVPVDVFPLGALSDEVEVLLSSVKAPTRLSEGDHFDLKVTAERRGGTASGGEPAVLRVLSGGIVVHEQVVALSRGENNFTVPLIAGAPGFARYQVQLAALEDSRYQNNQMTAFAEVVGPPSVLLVAPVDQEQRELAEHECDPLEQALTATGISVDRTDARRMPVDLSLLNGYASIVLVNVNARDLGWRKMAALQNYVRDLGGGLVAVGGPGSYAPGGYYRTPLEEALPVQMQLKDQERRANLTLYFVIDKSGSMADTSVGGIPKVELAKEAIIRSLGLLGPLDRAAVVAFDESAFWVVPPQSVVDSDSLADSVGRIRADGGTDIYAGLRAVADLLPEDPAALRHVILLTDGGASEAGNPELVHEMHQDFNATLSVVAIGEGYAPWIQRLPESSGGRFHFAYDPDTIPEIFTQETILATRTYIIESLFWPTLAQDHPIMRGISATPPLSGYVGTSRKPAAHTVLTTPQDDPLLSAWRYGLGKSVAWTSDATGRWAVEWITWPGFATFWDQATRWTMTQERGNNVDAEIRLLRGRAEITAEATLADGGFLNGLELEARVSGPDNTWSTVVLRQTAPGRYGGSFEPTVEGAYLIRLTDRGPAGSVAQTVGWVMSYSPEYRNTDPDHQALHRLAESTGGRILTEPEESLSHNLPAPAARRPIWTQLLLAAAILLPVDVAVRRLAIGRKDLQAIWPAARVWMADRLVRRAATTVPSAQVRQLLRAKRRTRHSAPMVGAPIGKSDPLLHPPTERPSEEAVPDSEALQATTQPVRAEGTLAGRLLDNKRRRNSHD
jgi:uncharacterized membrane protein